VLIAVTLFLGFIAAALLAAGLSGLVDILQSRRIDHIEGMLYSGLRGYLERTLDGRPATDAAGDFGARPGFGRPAADAEKSR
jgi:hypothetical protein